MGPRSVLAVGARPLDVEFHAGASLAHLIDQGAEATLVVCADDPGENTERAFMRRRETQLAGEAAGFQKIDFLGEELRTPGADLRRALVRCMRQTRPALVLCPDPAGHWIDHGGHLVLIDSWSRAVGDATLDAAHPRAATSSSYPELTREGFGPWLVPEVWLFESPAPDHFVDVTDALAIKRAVLACHRSEGPLRLTEEAEAEAERWRVATGFAAEAFRRLRLV